jgi:hypothetical protein
MGQKGEVGGPGPQGRQVRPDHYILDVCFED